MGVHASVVAEGAWPVSQGGPRILLIVGGGIAAYKSCELVRLVRKAGGSVTCVLTEGGQQFVTPMALAALSGNKVYTSLFDLKDEVEMGHIQLSREADLVVVCPATADLLAKMAAGIADDLATTLILATDKPVLTVPAMNVRMWEHSTTRRNAEWLRQAGVAVMEPDEGEMACGEWGPGRLPEPVAILGEIARTLDLDLDIALPAPQPEPAALAAPGPPAEAVEALEPEEEPEAPKGTLSTLLSAIIPRSTARRSHEDIDAELDALPELPPELDPFDAEGLLHGTPIEAAPPPPPGGPLLASKGKASAAPPTDREAINHEVARQDQGARPEPVAAVPGAGPAVSPAADPLAGQAEFDPDPAHRPLYGRHVVVTAGPTWEPIDPIRYIANRSSGKQGYAIAAMAAAAGARVTLISGPVSLSTPLGVDRVDVESAEEMAEAVRRALPADAAFMVAAVADWKSRHVAGEKMKKRGSAPPALILTENPDILTTLAAARKRPRLLVGFAAETENVIDNAKSKRKRKGADWIVANDVTRRADGGGVMGGDRNHVHIVTSTGVEELPEMDKDAVARELVRRAAEALAEAQPIAVDG
ncbi:bifunctional phosphopantothenoylcysteine decarboxylase/phosphopantothenate synthase [Qipengyuania sediminis]|uniref:bifunctional phosphopantothenoylcysteine decarboxylase/phosphopantothenate synthase n=1 Tax=Qipengyuania sediminis TaxID=1532023 RepID=UPI0010599ECE|nr:bifunctional phosphopantothenoylcysteine decarboxylase/phosphopantothenate synthase [Qipengyuania sediminis]